MFVNSGSYLFAENPVAVQELGDVGGVEPMFTRERGNGRVLDYQARQLLSPVFACVHAITVAICNAQSNSGLLLTGAIAAAIVRRHGPNHL